MTRTIVGTDVTIPESTCINCGHVNDRAFALGADIRPCPGDVTICVECGHLMVFTDDLRFRNPNSDELKRFAGDPMIVAAMTALDDFKREKQK